MTNTTIATRSFYGGSVTRSSVTRQRTHKGDLRCQGLVNTGGSWSHYRQCDRRARVFSPINVSEFSRPDAEASGDWAWFCGTHDPIARWAKEQEKQQANLEEAARRDAASDSRRATADAVNALVKKIMESDDAADWLDAVQAFRASGRTPSSVDHVLTRGTLYRQGW